MSREAAEAMATVSRSDYFQVEDVAAAGADIVAVHCCVDDFPSVGNGKPMHFLVSRYGGTPLRA